MSVTSAFGVDWQNVDSQIISAAAHDGQSLYVTFQDGSSYAYDNVDPSVLDELLAKDADKLFLADIRDAYSFTRLSKNFPRGPYRTQPRLSGD